MKKNYAIVQVFILLFFTNLSFGQFEYPGGDSCSSAVPIPAGMGYVAELDSVDDSHWYSFTAPCNGILEVSTTEGEGLSTTRRLYSGECDSLSLISEAVDTWSSGGDITHLMWAGEEVYLEVSDSWDGDGVEFDVSYGGCPELDSTLLDVQGSVFFDTNENGIQDIGEFGKVLNSVTSDPFGFVMMTGIDGAYYRSVSDIEDGTYVLTATVPEYWHISSDSISYTLEVDDDYEQRDSLDFGIYPDTLIHKLTTELIGGFPRCNDTIQYWINLENTGTTIAPSVLVHLEIDDSLYYVNSDYAPDSIVGQNIYWSHEDIYYYESEMFHVELGTPDGFEDTVLSVLSVTVDSADVEVFSSIDTLEQVITCAYDPNDKTPTPLGEGEFGYVDPELETIEYLVRFQNTGTDTAFNVLIADPLDENLIWSSIDILATSHTMQLEMDPEGEVSFIFDDILLPDSATNPLGSQGFVKFSIDLEPGLPLETSILNTAYIYFDFNPAIVTNTAINTLHEEGDNSNTETFGETNKVTVYPNPFTESTTVSFEEALTNHSIQIVDLLGNQVYVNNNLTGNQLTIARERLQSGVYMLLIIDDNSNEAVYNTRLIVQ